MRALLPTHSILGLYPEPERCLEWFERIGRICYKSEERITETSAPAFVRSILKLDRMEKLRRQFETLVTDYIHLSKDEKVERLLERVSSMLDDPPHESVIEHSMMTVHFRFDRGVSHEIVRHRLTALTQESTRYCVAGSMTLSSKNPHNQLTVADLYKNKTTSTNGAWKRITVRQLNEQTGELVYGLVDDVFHTGTKPTLRVRTRLGYELLVTKDHDVLTRDGYRRAEELQLGEQLAVNGEQLAYRNKKWLQHQYVTLNKTAVEIAAEYGFTTSVVKAWVRRHQLPRKPLSYWNRGRVPWNKGLSEGQDARVQAQATALRESHWNAGRVQIPRGQRVRKLSRHTYHKVVEDSCELCAKESTLQVHHLDGNRENNGVSNLITLCAACHQRLHSKNLEVVLYDPIVSIEPGGTTDVYDIAMRGPWKNFVANGVVVHNCNYNSGKFGGEIATIEPSFWAPKDGEDATLWKEEYLVWKEAMKCAERAYNDLIKLGAKPQEARSVLPNSLKTEIVVSANFREWRHIFRLRTSTRAHPQMREVMVPLLQEVQATPNLGLLFEDIHVTEAP